MREWGGEGAQGRRAGGQVGKGMGRGAAREAVTAWTWRVLELAGFTLLAWATFEMRFVVGLVFVGTVAVAVGDWRARKKVVKP